MYTYQDWMKYAKSNEKIKMTFIKDVIFNYMYGKIYNDIVTARAYYNRKNVEIMRRRGVTLSLGEFSKSHKRATRPVNRKCCGFFTKSVNQLSMYLLGNGVSLPASVKKVLGTGFDITLQKIGRDALIDGVCWGYWDNNGLISFKASEFIPLYDECTGVLKAGIRFYQMDSAKPMYIELFEIDGITEYKYFGNEMTLFNTKRAYYNVKVENGFKDVSLERDIYSELPIIPFYANDCRESTLTEGLKNDIDLYDRIMSDFGDNLDRANDIYYVVQNYGGANLKQLIDEIEEYKAIYTDGESSAQIKTIEVPYQARSEALRLLERQMYKETQTLDTEELTGGSLTNVAIKSAMTELDLKTDMFEWQAEEFVRGVLRIAMPEFSWIDIVFRRRSMTNDSEMIDNIYKMREDINLETALMLNPLLTENMVKQIIEKKDDINDR